MDDMEIMIGMLTSKSVMERKEAIKLLKPHVREGSSIAALSLLYVAEHDPCYTVRNMARQAYYCIGQPPETSGSWETVRIFQSE